MNSGKLSRRDSESLLPSSKLPLPASLLQIASHKAFSDTIRSHTMSIPSLHLQLCSHRSTRLIPLDQHVTLGIRIHRQQIQRIPLTETSSGKQILINVSIESTQCRIQLPIREIPTIHQTNRMRSDLCQQVGNAIVPDLGHLRVGTCSRSEEFETGVFEGVEGVESEKGMQDLLNIFRQLSRFIFL